ncbi:COG4695 Phage-related protein [uncultured Caudovirales phage]|uniref:COG4695 Phage-related protein n=1 Tax=uncultured Caudovirales phage TaxID=2100421 RepID=A0A6J5QQE2_9CAUD|nr:COG4695 Phage-related protein [uncultured Caudovirales phage]
MGLLDSILRRRPSAVSRESGTSFELRGAGFEGWNQFISPDAITPEVAIRVTSILACVRFIAQGVASMPVRILREDPDGDCKPAVDLPCYRTLVHRPNSWQSPYEYRETSIYHTALYGNAYSRIIPDVKRGGFCAALHPLHPTRVRVHRLSDGTLGYKYVEPKGTTLDLRQDEIVHYRWLSDNSYAGMVPSDLCSTSLALARKLDQAATAWWDNSARPDVVIETSETVNEEAIRTFRQMWREIYGGPRARGAVAILPKKSTLRTIESNAAEAGQYSQLRRDIALEVANVYGVPGSLVGIREVKSYNTTEQEHLSAQVWCLLPWECRFEGAWDRCLLSHEDEDPRFRGVYAKFDDTARLRADTETRSKLYDVLAKWGAVSPNELRTMEDLPRLDDPAADRTFIQSGFTTLENAADTSMTDGQLAQLVEILSRVGAGTLPGDAAELLVIHVWPQIPPAAVAKMVAGALAIAAEEEAEEADSGEADSSGGDLEGGEPAAAAATAADGDLSPVETNFAAAALNGAQISSLLLIIESIATGLLSPSGAAAVIGASFPQLTQAQVGSIISGVNASAKVGDSPAPDQTA